jgi:hypothetical protein
MHSTLCTAVHTDGLSTCKVDVDTKNENVTKCDTVEYYYYYYYYLVCEAIGTAATPGLLWQMIVEKQMECWLAAETEVLRENLPQRQFCPSQNPTWLDPVLNPGRCGGKSTTNRLSYGAAQAGD